MKKTSNQARKPGQSPEKWSEIVSAWKTSSLSEEEFTAKNNITVTTLSKWCRAMENHKSKTKLKKRSNKQNHPEFVPVKVVGQPNPEITPDHQEKIEMVFKDGNVVRLQGNLAPSKIAEIYKAIVEEVQC